MADAGPFPVDQLTGLVRDVLLAAGVSAGDAEVVANCVVDAEARENRSQGLVRVAPYVRWARTGKIVSPTEIRVERDSGSVLVVDAQNGWGHVAASRAMDLCVRRAAETGVALAVIRNTNHIGRLGWYVEQAAAAGMVGFIACSGNPESAWVAPWGGTRPLFGTNPLALGFPNRDGPPVVVDISTTQGARGNVLVAQALGRELPPGWAFDSEGRETRDPHKALPPHGTLAPLGGHKGYALAIAVEILCGVLAGLWPPDSSANFVGAVQVDAFEPADIYQESLRRLIGAVKDGPRREGFDDILFPGEGSARRRAKSLREGVTVPQEVWTEVVRIAKDVGVDHPLLS